MTVGWTRNIDPEFPAADGQQPMLKGVNVASARRKERAAGGRSGAVTSELGDGDD